MNDKRLLLSQLPKVDIALGHFQHHEDHSIAPAIIKSAIRDTIERFRRDILSDKIDRLPATQEDWDYLFAQAVYNKAASNLRRVINGTGIVIHTNLGRSLLGPTSIAAIQTAGACFTNLEFDLSTGKRGSRYSLVGEIICDLTGAEAAIVVNNNAAAVLLSLNTLSYNKETIVSRGQLVEIGGSFRIPDVMERSGAKMVEVGATNRTHLFDYEHVINDETALLLKVHTSNFKVIGFTSEVPVTEMVILGKKFNIPVMEDLGSGSLIDLSPWGLPKEPTVQEIIKAGADVVTFSGDKLLGGPQAGIIVGKKDIISRIKNNPMNRALRIDKFTLASLETVLREYYDFESALKSIPTLSMLTIKADVLKQKGQKFIRRLGGAKKLKGIIKLVTTISKVGGGAMPEHGLHSWAFEITPDTRGASGLENSFRELPVPLIVRIENEKLIVDLRTITDQDVDLLITILKEFLQTRLES